MLGAGEFHLEITTNKRSETRKMFGTWCVFDNYGYLGDYIRILEFFIVNHALPGYWGFATPFLDDSKVPVALICQMQSVGPRQSLDWLLMGKKYSSDHLARQLLGALLRRILPSRMIAGQTNTARRFIQEIDRRNELEKNGAITSAASAASLNSRIRDKRELSISALDGKASNKTWGKMKVTWRTPTMISTQHQSTSRSIHNGQRAIHFCINGTCQIYRLYMWCCCCCIRRRSLHNNIDGCWNQLLRVFCSFFLRSPIAQDSRVKKKIELTDKQPNPWLRLDELAQHPKQTGKPQKTQNKTK